MKHWPSAPFSNDGQLATTAYVQRAQGNFSGIWIFNTITLTAQHAGGFGISNAAGSTVTLPLANGVGWASGIWITNISNGEIAVQRQGGDSIAGPGGNVARVVIPAGKAAVFSSDNGSVWYGGGELSIAASSDATIHRALYGDVI